MKKRILPLLWVVSALFTITSCENNENEVKPSEEPNAEFRHIRVLAQMSTPMNANNCRNFDVKFLCFTTQKNSYMP